MPIKHIVVFVDPSPATENRVGYALAVARQQLASITAVFVEAPAQLYHPAEAHVRGNNAMARLIQRWKVEARLRLWQARKRLKNATKSEKTQPAFKIIRATHAQHDSEALSLYADLVIAGPATSNTPHRPSAEAILLHTGVPCIIVPDGYRPGDGINRVLLAWNESREARRAAIDSLPLLATAKTVFIANINHQQHASMDGTKDIVQHLTRHDVSITATHIAPQGLSIADALLLFATEHSCDLIVLGAYSHARSIEMILGGTTRSMLQHPIVPLLIAH